MINDGQWHHICITWTTRDGVWEAYQDGTQGGNGENLAPYHPIKPQGVLVLGQEQVLAWGRGAGCRGRRARVGDQGKGGARGEWEGEGAGSPHSQKEPKGARDAAVWAKSLPWEGFSRSIGEWALLSVLWWLQRPFLWHRKASLPLATRNLFPESGLSPIGHPEGSAGGRVPGLLFPLGSAKSDV